jgi:hypothetical protein
MHKLLSYCVLFSMFVLGDCNSTLFAEFQSILDDEEEGPMVTCSTLILNYSYIAWSIQSLLCVNNSYILCACNFQDENASILTEE